MSEPADGAGLDLPDLENPPVTDGSLAARIERSASKRSKVLRIKPSRYGGDVVLVCHKLTPRQVIQASQIKAPWAGAAELLVKACEDVILINPETGGEEPQGIGLDGRLAALFPSISGDDPREIARTTFGGDVELITAGQRLADWTAGKDLEELSPEDVADLVGEEEAATSS